MGAPSDENAARHSLRRPIRRAVAATLAISAGVILLLSMAYGLSHDDARKARRAIRARRFEDAREPLSRWLRAHPDSAEAHLLKAQVAYSQGRHSEATEELKNAYDRGARGDSFERLRGLLLVRNRQFSDAEPILLREFAAERAPDPDVDEALTIIYLENSRLKEAGWVLDRWARDVPDDPKPYLWRTELDRRSPDQDPDQIEAHYREALKRDPNLAAAQLGLAELLRMSRRFDEAKNLYESYLTQCPDDATGHLGAARNALGSGDQEGALRHLDRALALAPDDKGTLIERARIDFRRGAAADALKALDRAARSDSFDPDLLALRARVLTRLGRTDDAMADQDRLRTLKRDQARLDEISERLFRDPDNLSVQYEVAQWMFEHGRTDAGVRLARKILSVDPNHIETNRLMVNYHAARGETGLANYYRLAVGSSGK
ncbi:MAG: tetratricopeptide repeat protein [Isosphaeraceae bacterium]|nr:tetratricopeptide repeat protein [Isosphaeraceae bacterium]